jgi:sulfate/thiosulfate transport system ATP-binding protein
LGTVKNGWHLPDSSVGYIRPHEVHLSRIASANSLPVEVYHVHSVGASVRIEIKRLDTDTLIEAELSVDEYRRTGPFYKGDRLNANCDSMVVFQNQHILEESQPKTVVSTV